MRRRDKGREQGKGENREREGETWKRVEKERDYVRKEEERAKSETLSQAIPASQPARQTKRETQRDRDSDLHFKGRWFHWTSTTSHWCIVITGRGRKWEQGTARIVGRIREEQSEENRKIEKKEKGTREKQANEKRNFGEKRKKTLTLKTEENMCLSVLKIVK